MHHPVLLLLARAKARQELRAKGHGFLESIQLANLIDDNLFDTAVSLAPAEAQVKLAELADTTSQVRAIGDGSLIKIFTDFLASDLGKMLMAFIMSLLAG
jgi:multidrug resistance efflux pump